MSKIQDSKGKSKYSSFDMVFCPKTTLPSKVENIT